MGSLQTSVVFVLLLFDSSRATGEVSDHQEKHWVTNNAMDLWYGDKTVIELLTKGFSDLIQVFTSRTSRQARYESNLTEVRGNITEVSPANVSKVEIKFKDEKDETMRVVTLSTLSAFNSPTANNCT